MIRQRLPLLLTSALASALALPASAQIVCTLTVAHDDPDGIVTPGQVVRIDATLSWELQTAVFASIKGSLNVSPAVGTSSNRGSEFTQGGLVNLGSFTGPSLTGIDITTTPPFFTGGFVVPPAGNYWGVEIISFDWQAPTDHLGVVNFDWQPEPPWPGDVRFYNVPGFPLWAPGAAIYVGTQLTVVPTPSLPAFALAVAGWHAIRRRRQ